MKEARFRIEQRPGNRFWVQRKTALGWMDIGGRSSPTFEAAKEELTFYVYPERFQTDYSFPPLAKIIRPKKLEA